MHRIRDAPLSGAWLVAFVVLCVLYTSTHVAAYRLRHGAPGSVWHRQHEQRRQQQQRQPALSCTILQSKVLQASNSQDFIVALATIQDQQLNSSRGASRPACPAQPFTLQLLAHVSLAEVQVPRASGHSSGLPHSHFLFTGNVTILGNSAGGTVLDLDQVQDLITLGHDATLTLKDITFVNTPQQLPTIFVFPLFSLKINRTANQVLLYNCIVVVPPDELVFVAYWVQLGASPPLQGSARWIASMVPMIRLAPLSSWNTLPVLEARGVGCLAINHTLTSEAPDTFVLKPIPVGILDLVPNVMTPTPQVLRINQPEDLLGAFMQPSLAPVLELAALVPGNNTQLVFLLVSNMTLPSPRLATTSLALPPAASPREPTTATAAAAAPVRALWMQLRPTPGLSMKLTVDLQHNINVIPVVPGAVMLVSCITLLRAAALGTWPAVQLIEALDLPLRAFGGKRDTGQLFVRNLVVSVSTEELAIWSALADYSAGNVDSGSGPLRAVHVWHNLSVSVLKAARRDAHTLSIAVLVSPMMWATNMVLSDELVPGYSRPDLAAAFASFGTVGAGPPTLEEDGGHPGHSSSAALTGAIAGAVIGASLLCLITIVLVVRHRQQQNKRSSKHCSTDAGTALEKLAYQEAPLDGEMYSPGRANSNRDCASAPASQSTVDHLEHAALPGLPSTIHGAVKSQLEMMRELHALSQHLRKDIQDKSLVIMAVVGSGSSGTVYRGIWQGLPVAVKTLTFSTPMAHSALMEAALSKSITHPHIVATYCCDLRAVQAESDQEESLAGIHIQGEAIIRDWRLYIIQLAAPNIPPTPLLTKEFCDGGALRSLIDRKYLWDRHTHQPNLGLVYTEIDVLMTLQHCHLQVMLLELAMEICDGMAHLHDLNIIHGDLSPANILLRHSQTVPNPFTAKIADFGLSIHMKADQSHVSNTKRGTPFYTAPEVVKHGNLTKAADVYSYGVVLWELYMGTSAWQSTAAGLMLHPWFPNLLAGCPPGYAALVQACMDPEYSRRPMFPTIQDKLQVLVQLLEASPPSSTLPHAGPSLRAMLTSTSSTHPLCALWAESAGNGLVTTPALQCTASVQGAMHHATSKGHQPHAAPALVPIAASTCGGGRVGLATEHFLAPEAGQAQGLTDGLRRDMQGCTVLGHHTTRCGLPAARHAWHTGSNESCSAVSMEGHVGSDTSGMGAAQLQPGLPATQGCHEVLPALGSCSMGIPVAAALAAPAAPASGPYASPYRAVGTWDVAGCAALGAMLPPPCSSEQHRSMPCPCPGSSPGIMGATPPWAGVPSALTTTSVLHSFQVSSVDSLLTAALEHNIALLCPGNGPHASPPLPGHPHLQHGALDCFSRRPACTGRSRLLPPAAAPAHEQRAASDLVARWAALTEAQQEAPPSSPNCPSRPEQHRQEGCQQQAQAGLQVLQPEQASAHMLGLPAAARLVAVNVEGGATAPSESVLWHPLLWPHGQGQPVSPHAGGGDLSVAVEEFTAAANAFINRHAPSGSPQGDPPPAGEAPPQATT